MSGTTISEREAVSQAICPGNACTSATSSVWRRAAEVPQTPWPKRDAHAGGLALEGPDDQFARLQKVEARPVEVGQGIEDQCAGIGRVGDQVVLAGEQSREFLAQPRVVRGLCH